MTFTADTFKDLCEVIATADYGCPSCSAALADEMAKRWPEFPWRTGVAIAVDEFCGEEYEQPEDPHEEAHR